MTEILSTNQALNMFTKGTGMRWRTIRPDQVNEYQKNVFQLCLDRTCRQSLWVVPQDAVGSNTLYDDVMQRLSYATNNAVAFIPKLKFDLDNFKTHHQIVKINDSLIDVAIKPSADIVLFDKDTKSPFSLSYARGIHLKYSGSDALSNYLNKWYTISPDGFHSGGLRLLIGPKNAGIMITVAFPTGTEQIKAKIDLPPSDISLGRWTLERHISFDLTITNITEKKIKPEPHLSTNPVSGSEIAIAGVILFVGAIATGGLELLGALGIGAAAG